MNSNVMGVVHAAAAVLPQMREQGYGTFVVAGSLLDSIATPLMGRHVTSKWAVHGLVRALQIEQRPFPGVHVCLVILGPVRTPIYGAVAAIRALLDRPRSRRSVGVANYVVTAGFGYMPALLDALVTPMVRRLALSSGLVQNTAGKVFRPSEAGRRPDRDQFSFDSAGTVV